jgi:flagellar protein FlaJ
MKLDRVKKAVKPLTPIAMRLEKLRPSLRAELSQIEAEIDAPTYIAISILAAVYHLVFIFTSMCVLLYVLSPKMLADFFGIIILMSFAYSFVIFFQVLLYPRLVLQKKTQAINRDLLFAMRHLLIEVRAGIPLYTSFVSVGEAGYGTISEEFYRTANEISSGVSQTDALENMVVRNPSIYLRRAIWQISNALKAGSDIAGVLETLVKEFAAEERANLQRFGKELSPWALMYLLLTVVFPTMGIALFLVLGTITTISIGPTMLVFFVGIFIAFQFFFLKFLKNKRPLIHF